MVKKFVILIIVTVMLLVSSSRLVLAEDGPWYAPTYDQFNTKVFQGDESEIFGERYTQAQVYWIFYSLQNVLLQSGFMDCLQNGVDGSGGPAQATDLGAAAPGIEACTNDLDTTAPATGAKNMGTVLGLAYLVDGIKNTKPASGIEYIANKLHDLNIVPAAYAQGPGFGYTTLSATQNLWTATRNMAYGLLVLVFIITAFMIMFRVKLSPQTVITVQSALPRIIIAMLFIWFSYAIAGLLIDLAYLVQGIVAAFLNNSEISNAGVVEFITKMNYPAETVLALGYLVVIIAVIPAAAAVVIAVTPVAGLAAAPALLLGAIILLLVLLVFIIALLKIVWLFLQTYANMLILIIMGPFMILGGALGFGGGGFGWMKAIVAQLSVFVSASVLIVIAHVFVWGSGFASALSGSPALNPFAINSGGASIGSVTVPGFGAASEHLLGFVVGLVVLLGIPKMAAFVRDSINKPLRLELGVGQAFGQAGGLGMSGYQAYSAPYKAAFDADIANKLKAGTALTRPERTKLQLQQLGNTAQKIFRGR